MMGFDISLFLDHHRLLYLSVKLPQNFELKRFGDVGELAQNSLPRAFSDKEACADTGCFADEHSFSVKSGVASSDYVPILEPQFEYSLVVYLITEINITF